LPSPEFIEHALCISDISLNLATMEVDSRLAAPIVVIHHCLKHYKSQRSHDPADDERHNAPITS
jgi:hypothetical protein